METPKDPRQSGMITRLSGNEVGEKVTPLSSTQDMVASKEKPMATTEKEDSVSAEEKHEYLRGVKLYMTMFSISLVGFLFLLDTSIVSTVSWHPIHALGQHFA